MMIDHWLTRLSLETIGGDILDNSFNGIFFSGIIWNFTKIRWHVVPQRLGDDKSASVWAMTWYRNNSVP